MKFSFENPCGCGGSFIFSAYGDADFGQSICTSCGEPGYLVDQLSISVTAERLLFRSKAELGTGEYSLSTVIAGMAVESYLTRLFFKFKGMANYASAFDFPTPADGSEARKLG